MMDDPYADLVARLTGADPDRLLPVDALRLYDSDQATFPLSAEDAEGVRDVIDEAADAILKLQGEVASQRASAENAWRLYRQEQSRTNAAEIDARVARTDIIDTYKPRLEAAEAEVARMREIIEQITQECLSEDDGPVEQLEHILGIVSALQPGERT